MDELQKENRVLRQLQLRQEKALHRYDDTESEISQLLTRHSNETTSLRERLRRAQERERASERRLKDAEERLQRSQAAEARLRRLAEKQELGPREELSRQLEQEKGLGQEAQRRIKELQRGLELSNSSYQRQLAAERKKVVGVQEEMRTLQEELVRLSAKLKEKERELDTMNIYANRVMKPSARKDTDLGAKSRAPSITKAVQTEERPPSPGFPTPPPAAIADGNEYANRTPDNLSFKELHNDHRGQEGSRERRDEDHQEREMAKGRGREKEEKRPQKLFSNGPELKPKRSEEGREKEEKREPATLTHKLDDKRQRRGPLREEVEKEEVVVEKEEEVVVGSRWNQEEAEEERRRKDHLLAKLREIDLQKEPSPPNPVFSDRDPRPVPHQHHHHHHAASGPPPLHSLNPAAVFSFTALEESAGATHTTQGGGDGGMKVGEGVAGAGRRGLPRPQLSDPDDLTFGSYAPTIGRPPARGSISGGFPSPPPPPREGDKERERSAGSGEGRNSVSLMEQLFGTLATPPAQISSSSNRMAALASESRPRREKLFGPEAAAPGPFQGTLHVAESRPAVRAIASFDDDIEELTL
uniref:Lebercilin domain-containing protein n=1 Tax=Gadus morhua TaxID=8049 RepID=A0A8C5BM70_GADMO